MTTSQAPQRARAGLFRDSQRGQFARYPVAVSLAVAAIMFAVGAVVDLFDDADVSLPFAIAAVVAGGIARLELRAVPRPRASTAPAVLTMVTLAWVIAIAVAAVAHLIADATDRIDTAVLEGAATSTTTAMTTLDLDAQPAGLLAFRALSQWSAGLGALVVALIVIPLVMGGQEFAGRGQSIHARTALLTGRTRGTQKLLILYSGFTAVLVAAYLAAGMHIGDAFAFAMATASTGGLATTSSSLAELGAAEQWIAAAGMAVAGVNVGVLWWVLRNDREPVKRSTELKLYLAVLVLATAAVSLWFADAEVDAVRTAAVQVTSAMSTTGLTSVSWPTLDNGVQTILVALLGIGAMAGSAGGGFRYLRMIEAFGFARRELTRQLHPTAIRVVRVNGRGVSERSLERMTGYMVVFILTGAIGAAAIALGDASVDPTSAVTMAISALSTGGPFLGSTSVAELGWFSKLALSALMLLGRLSIYAVLVAIGNTVGRLLQFSSITWPSRGTQ